MLWMTKIVKSSWIDMGLFENIRVILMRKETGMEDSKQKVWKWFQEMVSGIVWKAIKVASSSAKAQFFHLVMISSFSFL